MQVAIRTISWIVTPILALITLMACIPEPTSVPLPTLPAVLDITPAPTLDIEATATVLSSMTLPTPTVVGLYTVQSGDTLTALAARFATTVEALMVANGLSDPNTLLPGQTLVVPLQPGTANGNFIAPLPSSTPTAP